MRRFLGVAFVALFGLATGPVEAGVQMDVKNRTYKIQGRTGAELMQAMVRKGPRQGYAARAIAQTSYTLSWDIDWQSSTGQSCRASKADVHLTVNYLLPEISGSVSPGVQKTWARFIVGVRKHENVHGATVEEMATVAQAAVMRVKTANDPGCRNARRLAKDVVKSTYADYEGRQVRFDAVEHRSGGTVQKLTEALVRG